MKTISPLNTSVHKCAIQSSRPRDVFVGALISLALLILSGCPSPSPSDEQRVGKANDSASSVAARKLLDEVIAAYAHAEAYHDDARIIVRYRMNGRPMEEHQLWAVDFRRPHQLAARLFNARIQSDQERTTAMVFDFDSQNMDNQYLVLGSPNGPPWNEMFADPVCRHFISGSSEIPFNSRLPGDMNLPPTIGLLFGQPAVEWMLHPEHVEMLDDAQANGKAIRRVCLEHNRRKYELWIDPESRLIVQASLPNQFLDEALLIAPEISDLRLTVQFTDATFAPDWSTNPFSNELPQTANPVARFVPLPERFPSECIGKPLSPISVTAESGLATSWSPQSMTTVLAWVDRQDISFELIRRLDTLAENSADQPLRIQLCYVEFVDPNPESQRPIDLPQYIRDGGIRLPIVSDVGLVEGEKLGVKFAPTVIILDKLGVVQFFQAFSTDKWKSELPAAISRVQNGENLASEMRAEYAKFIDVYQDNLRKLNPLASATPAATKPVSHHSIQSPRKPGPPLWQFTNVKLPGNITSLAGSRLLINDGWQTVLELDPQTQAAQRHPLELDPEMSVTTLRTFHSRKGTRIAAFSEMGRQVLVVSEDWKTVGSFTCEPDSQIRDVQVCDQDSDEKPQFWLLETKSFPLPRLRGRGQGEGEIDNSETFLTQYDETLSQQLDQIKVESAESFIAIPSNPLRFLVIRSDGQLVPISQDLSPKPAVALGQLKVRRLFPSPDPNLLACAVALDEHGQWQALGITPELEIGWTHAIGPQEFERQIQPVAALALDSSRSLFAFAASDDTITVLSDVGLLVDLLQWPAPIHGLSLLQSNGVPTLFVSEASQITANEMLSSASKDIDASR